MSGFGRSGQCLKKTKKGLAGRRAEKGAEQKGNQNKPNDSWILHVISMMDFAVLIVEIQDFLTKKPMDTETKHP